MQGVTGRGTSEVGSLLGACRHRREQWIDAAKGVTILLVVLHHVCQVLDQDGVNLGGWAAFDAALTAVRMPLFFLLSGLFAARVVHGPARRLWRDRVGRFVYLFTLWSVLYLPFYSLAALLQGRDVVREVMVRAKELSLALSPMWFILALGGFFAIARLLRAVPPRVQLVGAAALSVSVFFFDVRYPFDKLWLLLFFLLGCYCSRQIRAAAQGAGVDHAASALAFRPLRWVGGRTLPVCLLHVPVLSVLPWATLTARFGPVTPVVGATIGAVGALGAWLALRRVPGLFDLPVRWGGVRP